MQTTPRCYILVIRVTASLTLVLIWIICSPYQSIGRGLILTCYQVKDDTRSGMIPEVALFFHAKPLCILPAVNRGIFTATSHSPNGINQSSALPKNAQAGRALL